MNRILFLPIFVAFFFCSLLAEEKEPTVDLPSDSFAYTDGMPSNVVHDSVCVMSGEYFEDCTDFDIPGPENLSLRRNYCSFKRTGIHEMGWYHNHNDRLRHGVLIASKDTYGMIVPMSSGNVVGYTYPKFRDYKKQPGLRYQMRNVIGKTILGGKFSGRTNINNQIVHHIPSLDEVQIVTPEGHFDVYKHISGSEYGRLHQRRLNGFLVKSKSKEIKQDGERVEVKQISLSNTETGQQYSHFNRAFYSDSNVIHTSDGQEFKYTYHKHKYEEYVGQNDKPDKIQQKYLKQVSSPSLPTQSYDFVARATSKGLHVSRKKLPDHRYLAIEYYKKGDNPVAGINFKIKEADDPCLDRVKLLKAPVGADSKPVPIYSFIYMINTHKKKDGAKEFDGGTTDVRDAHGTLTRYRYDKNQRLNSVEQFAESGPYLLNNFVWSSEGHLKGQYVTDAQGKILYYNHYEYDGYGNTLNIHCWGILAATILLILFWTVKECRSKMAAKNIPHHTPISLMD